MSSKKIRLVIIEPHTAVRLALAKRLQSSSEIEVVSHMSDLVAAQEIVASQKPDAVLLGLKWTNSALTTDIIQDVVALAKTTAVITLSPYADDSASTYLLQAGVRRYLLKHIDTPQLIREIKAVTSGT